MSAAARPPVSVDSVIVIDYGGQTAQLIARRVREAHVYCELIPHDTDASILDELQPRGIILSGARTASMSQLAPGLPDWVLESGLRCSASATACG
ncbi:MAG: hypothetical protein R3A46_06490 [Thermomicrobiales bacterium]